VNDTFWDTLSVKVSEEINVLEVLEEERSVGSNTFVRVRRLSGTSLTSGEGSSVFLGEDLF
jgi:hypothetical protein